jgi:hypothetical protein
MNTSVNIGNCEFFYFCLCAGEGCTNDNTKSCDEFNRRRDLGNKKCPVVVKLSYKDTACDIPLLRTLIPVGLPCSINEICIRTFCNKDIISKLLKKIPLSAEEIQSIIIEIKKNLQSM